MPWYALERCGILVKRSIGIRISNRLLIKILLNLCFGMQVCIYPLRPMPRYTQECRDKRVNISICIPISNSFSIHIPLKHGFGMQVYIYSQGSLS